MSPQGQQITLSEQIDFPVPSVYNNTGHKFTLQDRLPITLVMEPKAHFKSPQYTDFKIILGGDEINTGIATPGNNTFSQPTSYAPGDIIPSSIPSETLKIDRLYDVYIESITTFDTVINNSKNTMSFSLGIDKWNIENATNMSNHSKGIIIPNESKSLSQTFTHKSRKLNYLTYLVPGSTNTITGKLSFLNGDTIFNSPASASNNNRITLELILIPRK